MIVMSAALGYGVIAAIIGCRLATLLAWHFALTSFEEARRRYPVTYEDKQPPKWPGGEQWFGAALLASLAATVWPFVLVAFALRGVLFAPPESVQMQRQQERIAELERELNLHA